MRHYRRYWKHGDYPIIAILVYEYSVADVSEMPYTVRMIERRIERGGDLPYWITPIESATVEKIDKLWQELGKAV